MIDVNAIKRFYNVNKMSVKDISKKIGVSEEEIHEVIFPKVDEVSDETDELIEDPVELEEVKTVIKKKSNKNKKGN